MITERLLDWQAEDVGASGFSPDLDCPGGRLNSHWPTDPVLGAHILEMSVCQRCDKTIVRPKKKLPISMAWRWASWQYAIEEEP